MSEIESLVDENATYAATFSKKDLPLPPARKTAIVACMDARLETGRLLGLSEGDAHVIRNAGGVVTDDVIRSIARIKASPFVPHKDAIRGFVYDVDTGRLREVDGA